MNNWFLLSDSQIESIRRGFPSFSDAELQYNGFTRCDRELIGGEWIYNREIDWLKVNINGEWVMIIDLYKELPTAPFRLTDSQYMDILEELKDQNE
jgi:hypothetical protein